MKEIIYLDNATTTKISPAVLAAMEPFMNRLYGNASSLYSLGRESAKAIDKSRTDIAGALNCDKRELYFTSGGSESNNWAIKGAAALAAKAGKKHIISSAFEHHAVLHVLEGLQEQGFEITLLPVYKDGVVKTADLEKAIRPDTGLVTIMQVNNEIGTVQPIREIGEICKEKKVLFHTDAVQAGGKINIDVKEQNIDMLSLAAHKFNGPKGTGVLYCTRKIQPEILIRGGGHERGRRAGTENIPAIASMAAAFEVMLNTTAIANLIRENKLHQINSTIHTSGDAGMQTMDSSLVNLYKKGVISKETAMGYSLNPEIISRQL